MHRLAAVLLPFVLGAAIAGIGFYIFRPAPEAVQAELHEKARIEAQLRQQQAGIESLRAQLELLARREAEHLLHLREALASASESRSMLETAEKELNDSRSRLDVALLENAHIKQTAQDALILLQDTRNQLDAALSHVGRLRGELSIAEAAKEHLAQELITAQEEAAQLRENLAFFEQLIPENTKTSGVSIRAAEFAQQGHLLRYRILVMRHSQQQQEFVGSLRFSATGERGGSSATIDLEPLPSAPISTGASTPNRAGNTNVAAPLKFRHYQRVSGFLPIPADFTPLTITVRVLEGKTVRAEHTSNLAPKE